VAGALSVCCIYASYRDPTHSPDVLQQKYNIRTADKDALAGQQQAQSTGVLA
jgi:hypothetical protein